LPMPPASEFSMPAKPKLKITALAGGVGASKLLLGLYKEMDPSLLTIIVNTGDDIVLHGLKISPDLDIVTYTLAGGGDSAKSLGFPGGTVYALKSPAGHRRGHWVNLRRPRSSTPHHRTPPLPAREQLSPA